MVPISEYATISEGSTLLNAVLALENAKVDLGNTIYPHWIVLILNSDNKVVGKLSQLNVLRALEPDSGQSEEIDEIEKFGFSSKFLTTLREDLHLENTSLENVYTNPELMNMKVEDFMKQLADNDLIDENTSLATAAHQMSVRKRLSMLVTRDDEVIGVLRLSDVFTAVINAVKSISNK